MGSAEWVVIIGAVISALSAITTAIITTGKNKAVKDTEVDDHFKLMELDTDKKIEVVAHEIRATNTKIDTLADTLADKIDALEVAQTKHNNLMERTFMLEKAVGVMEERQKVANHRIDDLEGSNGKSIDSKQTGVRCDHKG